MRMGPKFRERFPLFGYSTPLLWSKLSGRVFSNSSLTGHCVFQQHAARPWGAVTTDCRVARWAVRESRGLSSALDRELECGSQVLGLNARLESCIVDTGARDRAGSLFNL